MAENPEDLIVTDAELRRQLPALAKELKLGGSGVEPVSGTITLNVADGVFRQVYATAAATVQTERLDAGQAAIFRYFNGAWQVRVLSVDGSVKDPVWRAPGAPDLRTALTATGPTWVDNTSAGGGTWTTPTQAGIAYSPASGTAAPDQTVTVSASATDATKYRLDGTSSWTHKFPADPNAWGTLFADTFTRASDGALLGSALSAGGKTWSTVLGTPATAAGAMVPAGNLVRRDAGNSPYYLAGGMFDSGITAPTKLHFEATYNPAGAVYADGIALIFGGTSDTEFYGVRLSGNANLMFWVNGNTATKGGGWPLTVNNPSPSYNSTNTIKIDLDLAARTIKGTVNSNTNFIPEQSWPAGFTPTTFASKFGVTFAGSGTTLPNATMTDASWRIA